MREAHHSRGYGPLIWSLGEQSTDTSPKPGLMELGIEAVITFLVARHTAAEYSHSYLKFGLASPKHMTSILPSLLNLSRKRRCSWSPHLEGKCQCEGVADEYITTKVITIVERPVINTHSPLNPLLISPTPRSSLSAFNYQSLEALGPEAVSLVWTVCLRNESSLLFCWSLFYQFKTRYKFDTSISQTQAPYRFNIPEKRDKSQ